MTARLLLLLSLLLAACSHEHAQAAWTKAHWGMSVAEVRGAVPGLAGVLRKQFGQEASSKAADPSLIGLSRDTAWVASDTEILLGVAPVTGTMSMLLLNYRRSVK